MDTIGERLLYLINTQGVSMKKFCEKNGLSYQSINPICNNKREIGTLMVTFYSLLQKRLVKFKR